VIRAFAQKQPNPVVILQGQQQGMTANYLGLLCHPDLPPTPVAFADQDDLWLRPHLTRSLTTLALGNAPTAQVYSAHRMLLRNRHAPCAGEERPQRRFATHW
jgi:hypothetical protein